MWSYAAGLTLGVALTLGFTTLGIAGKEQASKDEEVKEDEDVVAARKDVVELAAAIKDGKGAKVVEARAKAIRDKHDDLLLMMKVFKLKEKGGLGIGAKPAAKSGIEKRLNDLSSDRLKPLSAAELKAESADLIEMAHVSIAMAEIVKPFFHAPKAGKGRQDWNRYADDQKKAADDLIKAVKAGNGKAVKANAESVVKACNDCHSAFR